jgi:membrane protein implicated in regulation of membrane protease activity
MSSDFIFSWWNLIFIAPFALALIYLAVYAVSGLTIGEIDAEHDLDVDHGVDVEHHIGSDHHLGDDSTTTTGQSSIFAALTWLGLGRVPISLVGMVLLLSWGMIGFITNVLAQPYMAEPWQTVMVSLPIALFGSIQITNWLTRLIGRYLPLHDTSARRRHALLGSAAEAIFAIDDKSGVVAVRDTNGNLFHVACRVGVGEPPLAKGSRVCLVSYRATDNVFFGKPLTSSVSDEAVMQSPAAARAK